MAEESNSAKAMKLAASSGMTLKEAWAQVKGESGAESADVEERGAHKIAQFKRREESW